MLYKQHQYKKLDELNARDIAKEVAQFGVVVIKHSGSQPKEFAEWSLGLGYHLSPEIWCTDREHSDLFWRVTNQKVDEINKGLLGDHELDWHCNVTPVLDGEEIIGLYGKTITYHTETWFCNSLPYWRQLDEETKKRYRNLTITLDPYRKLGRIQPGWSPNWETLYSRQIIEDIYKNRETRQIFNARNIADQHKALYKKSRGIIEDAHFVPRHPVAAEGLFFTPYEVHGFKENGEVCSDSKEIYWKIWHEMVASDRYTYKHVWEPGDIVLMDQTTTIHRRPDILEDKPRELLRIACWFKTELRNHYEYIL